VIVVEENHAFNGIIKSSGPRYINSLAERGALLISSYGISHPSEPNYLALFSGSTHGVHYKVRSPLFGLRRQSQDACRVSREIADGGIELRQRNLHFLSFRIRSPPPPLQTRHLRTRLVHGGQEQSFATGARSCL
jgi:hypothetical protein